MLAKVLVLDADQRSALAVVRSLGRSGRYEMYAADQTRSSLGGSSRYCDYYVQHPSLHDGQQSFTRWLVSFVRDHHVDWLIPVTDRSTQIVLSLRDDLGSCQLPFADMPTVMQLADKWNLVCRAKTLGIAVPRSAHFSNGSEVSSSAIGNFPVVLKPDLSQVPTPQGPLKTAVHVVHSKDELIWLTKNMPYLRDHSFMIQEYIPGTGAGVFALYNRGTEVAYFSHRRLREKPPSGGVSVLSESATPSRQALDCARRILESANWHGIAMVEFRVGMDGTHYLMEVNTRFWGSLQLAIDSGVDFPTLLLSTCQGERIPYTHYKLGVRLRWLLGDLDNLLLKLRKQKTVFSRSQVSAIIDFCACHPITTKHEIDRWNDFGPAIQEIKSYIGSLRMWKRQSGSSEP